MSRPEALFPLFADLDSLPGIGPKTLRAYEGIGVTRPRDLLFVLPHSLIDRRPRASIRDFTAPCTATVMATVTAHQPPRSKGRPWRVLVEDDAGVDFTLVFFHARGDYLARLLPPGARRLVSGKLELFDGIAQIAHPDHLLTEDEAATLPGFEPVYPLAAGLTQRLLARSVAEALARAPTAPEWIDAPLMRREGWPDWRAALMAAHAPATSADVAPEAPARQRLAYDELFAHQLTLSLARQTLRKQKGRSSHGTSTLRDKVLKSLTYQPTDAQVRAVAEIAADMAAPLRMNRLLQGDVGAGKTLVAALVALIAIEAGGQAAIMAPTEILARQHLMGLADLAQAAGIRLEILTGRDKGAERAAKLADLAAGRIHLLVGTHALFQRDVVFHDLRLAIVDEQHRFGVAQRMELGAKGPAADVLVMTATPIPRSLALASHGDMDVSVLDEKPPGRKPVRTALVSTARMDEVVAHLDQATRAGRQAYWVCPLVEESEVLDYASAEARFAHLRAALGEGRVGLVHGQMPPAEKDAAMARFVAGETSVLVATTVIEVGVNVPNASIMVIERAETFGLAQLHQLRGRVGRGDAQSTCLLMYQAPLSDSGEKRLMILRDTEDGFRIAEEDLAMRGAGDLIGTAQSGLPRFRIADLERQSALMEVAQSDARRLLADDPTLTSARGQAARFLLWLLDQDQAIRLIAVG